jgi:hydrogenase maturation protein HypF
VTNSSIKKSEIQGVEIRVQGIVQGVGFRPFIYNLAIQLQISGTVSNTSAGVFIEAAGKKTNLDMFVSRISSDAPPLAQIISLETRKLNKITFDSSFSILASTSNSQSNTAIPPDIALCPDCLKELLAPTDRRYLYPFINCTNCGPRFTIIETTPYDRPKTSMKVFPMCKGCEEEYNNPLDRRFHAQPNACPQCGPKISWHSKDGTKLNSKDPISSAISALNEDNIIAIRGLGGFHLVVNAFSEQSITLLRLRKNRPTKPLAVMVANIDTAESFCHVSEEEKQQLLSLQHPIVLLRKKHTGNLASNLCPGVEDIGIMLPYTPLHHVLFNSTKCPKALVMTSGNSSGQPICISNDTALAQLGSIADFFLLHNREILTRVDDSVTKLLQGNFRLFRRARGYSPSPIIITHELPQILGCGGGLKSTFCLARKNLAFLSQHIGDLFNLESFDFYTESIDHYKRVFDIEPEIVVRDLHPDYMSSQFAEQLDLPIYEVQHHHAHAVAVMAEHKLSEPVLAVVLDGTGYGSDGTIWGGEILLSSLTDFERLGHLQYLALPGGDAAAAEPWRMGISALYHTYGIQGITGDNLPSLLRSVDPAKREILIGMLQNSFNTPLTSSCGRLFDAIAALVNLRSVSDYEGHAAMELEALALKSLKTEWKSDLLHIMSCDSSSFLRFHNGKWEIISTEFVKVVMNKMNKGIVPSQIALEFHLELICAIAMLITQLSQQHSVRQVVLSGGCMQNSLLLEGLFYILEKVGLQVFTGEKIPVNDGGISFGQIIIGGLKHVSRDSHAGN